MLVMHPCRQPVIDVEQADVDQRKFVEAMSLVDQLDGFAYLWATGCGNPSGGGTGREYRAYLSCLSDADIQVEWVDIQLVALA
ncbi:hypothetical protein D3C76_1665770 [compost metagenome]